MALINQNPYSPIPAPKVNGGLVTGREATGPWGAIPTIPEAAWLNRTNLQSSLGVPISALFQMQAGVRPGNNSGMQIPEVSHYVGDPAKQWGPFDIYCVPEVCDANTVRSNHLDCRLNNNNRPEYLYNTEQGFGNCAKLFPSKKIQYLEIM